MKSVTQNLEKILYPESVAVIGASRQEGKVGHSILKNLLEYGYQGRVYPINPSAGEILGLKAYPSVSSIDGTVDLAVIAVPSQLVPSVLQDCGKKGIRSVIVISAGFKETGKEGLKLERALKEIGRDFHMRILGPNCLGVINTTINLNASFAKGMPLKGKIGFFSQSGALCTAVLDWALEEKVGFSKFISLGNKVDVDEVDLLVTLGNDPETRVILGYLEGIERGKEFMEVAKEVSLKKPIIITKSGKTQAGAKAASSHTGTLTGSDTAYESAFKQSGVIRADSIQELFDYAMAFSCQPVPRGPNLAIVTNAGGPGIIAADAVERSILKLATFGQETVRKLREELPANASLYNPVDVIGDARAERYEKAIRVLLEEPAVDSLLIILTPQAMTEIDKTAEIVTRISEKATDKPILTSFMGGKEIKKGVKILQEGGVPNYTYPEPAIRALEVMVKYRKWKDRPWEKPPVFTANRRKAERIFSAAERAGRANLNQDETREVLSAYGFVLPRRVVAETSAEAVSAANSLGYPVAMKIVSPDILHKSDVGGVRVGISNSSQVAEIFQEIITNVKRYMPQALILGVSVEEMVGPGKEVILGSSRDRSFGPVIMFGLGGIYVEALKDTSFRVAPIDAAEADAMIKEIRSYPILKGIRGQAPSDLSAVKESLLRLSQMVCDFPQILEMDINPLIVLAPGKGAVVVDARITIEK